MKKEPITTFLKAMSILLLIESVIELLINGLAVFLAPVVTASLGDAVDNLMWVNLAVTLVCTVMDIVIAVMALQHKNISLVYKLSIITLILPVVFSSMEADGVTGYVSVFIGAVIPALFCIAAFQQNKIDGAQ